MGKSLVLCFLTHSVVTFSVGLPAFCNCMAFEINMMHKQFYEPIRLTV